MLVGRLDMRAAQYLSFAITVHRSVGPRRCHKLVYRQVNLEAVIAATISLKINERFPLRRQREVDITSQIIFSQVLKKNGHGVVA